MSTPITVADLVYLPSSTLASLLSDSHSAAKTAVIDVRDSDHIGGHIKGSTWVPLPELDARIPELIRLNKNKERVVFHCMLSQQRGPMAALKYARAKQAMDLKEQKSREKQQRQRQRQDQHDQHDQQQDADDGTEATEPEAAAEVCVLEGGFDAWQARYGDEDKLTEAYVKDLWD
ncbi:hypothetical protein DV737_g2826, partial [Chaetothyriales sp. CBS 132003]